MDRSSSSSLIEYAQSALGSDALSSDAFIALSEAQRLQALSTEWAQQLDALKDKWSDDAKVQGYLEKAFPPSPEQTASPKKILVITNIFPPQELGGFGKYLFEFTAALKQMGHKVYVLCADIEYLHCEGRVDDCYFENEVDRSLKNYGNWKVSPPAILNNHELVIDSAIFNHMRIKEVTEEFKPDYCMIGNLDLLGYACCREIPSKGIPTLHLCGNTYLGFHPSSSPTSPLYRTAPCGGWLAELQRKEGKVFYPNFTLHAGSPLAEYYQYFPPRFDKLRVACASLIISRKGIHILVRALAFLKEKGIDFICEIAGDSPEAEYRQWLDGRIQELGVAENIKFLGLLNNQELRQLFGRSNVFVFPTTDQEPFGKSTIEAMAAGLLAISSGTGGQAEILEHGKTGLIYSPSSPEDLAKQFEFIIEHPDEWKRIASAGQEHAFQFDTMRCAEKIVPMFESIESDKPDLAQAKAHCQKIDEQTELCRSKYKAAIAALRQYNHDEACSIMESFEECSPLADYFVAQACFKLAIDRFDASADAFANCILEHPSDWRPYVGLSMLYKSNNYKERCFDMLAKAQNFNQEEAFVYLALISAYRHFGMADQADGMEVVFQKAQLKTSCPNEFMHFFKSAIA